MNRDLYGSVDEAIRRTQTASNDLVKDLSELKLVQNVHNYLNNQVESLKNLVTQARYVSDEGFDLHDDQVWEQVKRLQKDVATANRALESTKLAFAMIEVPNENKEQA